MKLEWSGKKLRLNMFSLCVPYINIQPQLYMGTAFLHFFPHNSVGVYLYVCICVHEIVNVSQLNYIVNQQDGTLQQLDHHTTISVLWQVFRLHFDLIYSCIAYTVAENPVQNERKFYSYTSAVLAVMATHTVRQLIEKPLIMLVFSCNELSYMQQCSLNRNVILHTGVVSETSASKHRKKTWYIFMQYHIIFGQYFTFIK